MIRSRTQRVGNAFPLGRVRRAGRAGLLFAGLAGLLASGTAAAPRLSVHPWTADLAPPVYGPADSIPARRYPPDTLGVHARVPLDASFTATPPAIDGRIDDWRFVRWYDLTGASTVFRGAWSGPRDFGLRFALTWDEHGVYLGGRLADDVASRADAPQQSTDRVTLALASSDPAVQRYWMGPSRRFRLGRHGRLEGWSDLRGRRPEPFDAAALGVRAACSPATSDSAGPLEFEIFVPWTALFPLLPGTETATFVNIVFEDADTAGEKAVAWATLREASASRSAWTRLVWGGGATAPDWIVAAATRAPDPWCEWVIVRTEKQASRPGPIEIRARGIPEVPAALRVELPAGNRFLVRLGPLEASPLLSPTQRAAHVELQLPGGRAKHEWDLQMPVDPAAVARAIDSEIVAIQAGASAKFPARTDVVVRLDRARNELESMGTWTARRFHSTGVLAWRSGTQARVDQWLADAELLRSAIAAGADVATRDALLARRWPQRGLGGLPADEVFLRGCWSDLDGTVQPHTVFVPANAGPHPPLVVALRDVDQNETTLFESTRLAERCAARGWVALCPSGRGTSGYMTIGERDVLEALAATREALPVDGRRLYVTGLGMGGTGAWLLSLRHPDLFAAAAIVSGYGDFDQPGLFEFLGYQLAEEPWYAAHNPARLVKRGLTTAFRIAHGECDAVVSPVHARVLHARLQELEVEHEYRLDPQGDHGTRFFDDELAASLEFFGRQARPADGQANMEAFEGVGGPIADVFGRGPFAIVWGTKSPAARGTAERLATAEAADLATAQQLAAEWKSKYGGAAHVLPDTAVTDSMLRTTTLVLVGDPQTNTLLARWKDRLPVHYEWQLCLVGKTGYPLAKFGVVFAAANPEFPDRTLVVASGMKDRIRLLPRSAFAVGAAYAVVSPEQGVVEMGNFDTEP